jgi:hypothetical protein
MIWTSVALNLCELNTTQQIQIYSCFWCVLPRSKKLWKVLGAYHTWWVGTAHWLSQTKEELKRKACAGFVRQKRWKKDSIYVPSLFNKRWHRLPPFLSNEPGTATRGYYTLPIHIFIQTSEIAPIDNNSQKRRGKLFFSWVIRLESQVCTEMEMRLVLRFCYVVFNSHMFNATEVQLWKWC